MTIEELQDYLKTIIYDLKLIDMIVMFTKEAHTGGQDPSAETALKIYISQHKISRLNDIIVSLP